MGVCVDGAAPDRLRYPGETAKRLALSPRTLDKLDKLGILPKVHVLGGVRYRESDIQQVIREGASAREAA